jgi:hypothetical protein
MSNIVKLADYSKKESVKKPVKDDPVATVILATIIIVFYGSMLLGAWCVGQMIQMLYLVSPPLLYFFMVAFIVSTTFVVYKCEKK